MARKKKDPMNDEHYDGNDAQIHDLKELVIMGRSALAGITARVANIERESQGNEGTDIGVAWEVFNAIREDAQKAIRRQYGAAEGAPAISSMEAAINHVNATAEAEGWAIFNDCEIQRIDSPDTGKEPTFDDAAAAALHVCNLASEGSLVHLAALGIVGLNDSPQLEDADLHTVLAALRFWQSKRTGAPVEIHNIADDFGTVTPLDDAAIDALCERLNRS